MHAVDAQLRAVSKMAVTGARAIWWKAAQLWGEQVKGKGLAVRNAIKAANEFYYKFFADEIGVYKRQWAATQENGATDGHDQDGRRRNGWSCRPVDPASCCFP